jgi:putative tricarboxylic transport membrane protein
MIDRREAALGASAVLLGIVVAVVARGFPVGSMYDALGSRLLPYIVAAGLVLTGLTILVGAFRQGRPAEPEALDLAPVLWIAGALIIPIFLIRPIGWIPVAALVFALGARAFGSRRTVLNLALGLAFGIVTFVLFNYALGLNLPAGSWIR